MPKLISYREALELIIKVGRERSADFKKRTELLALNDAVRRVCAINQTAQETVPSFNNSAMDGFVVRSAASLGASQACPKRFRVMGRILAGDALRASSLGALPSAPESSDTCFEIMTGAPIPDGFDAVYKIEDVRVVETVVNYGAETMADSHGEGAGELPAVVEVRFPLKKFENYRRVGADFEVGQNIIEAGTFLFAEHVMALASVGVTNVAVLRRPRIAYFSTGSELVAPDAATLEIGKIRNSTMSYLLNAIPLLGAEVRSYGIIADEKKAFRAAIDRVLEDNPDIIVTTGAVSKGSQDFIPDIIRERGAEIIFHNVAIRPGKPQLFGRFGATGPVFFGLPGNPISTVVGLRFFIYNYINALTGRPPERPLTARLEVDIKKPRGLRCFYKSHVEMTAEGARITALSGQPSFMVSSLLAANAWLVLFEMGALANSGETDIAGGVTGGATETSAVVTGARADTDNDTIEKETLVDFYPLYPFDHEYGAAESCAKHGRAAKIGDEEICC